MNKKYTYTLAQEHVYECATRRFLFAALVVGILAYMFLISLSVVHVVARKEANAQAVATATQIASLESQLFALNKEVGEDEARERNLFAIEDKHFVTRTQVLGRADVY